MRLKIEAFGRGRDLVLLHGWGMHSGVWRKQAQELTRQFRVHLVHLPGHGRSRNGNRFSRAAIVSALAEQLPKPLVVAGWSLGATIALDWALVFSEQVQRLTLVAATPCFGARTDWDFGWPAETIEAFERELGHDPNAALERFLGLQMKGDSPKNLRTLRQLVFSAKPPCIESLESGLDILKTTDLRKALANISQPALVVHGDCDAIAPLAAGEFLASRLPQGRLALFAGCGHAPFLSRPEKFIADVIGFLDD